MDPNISSSLGQTGSLYQTPGVVPGTSTEQVAFQSYEDAQDSMASHPLQFNPVDFYDTVGGVPVLPSPKEGEQPVGPYGPSEQTLIKNYFSSEFLAAATKAGFTAEEASAGLASLMGGKTLAEPLATQIANLGAEVTAKVIDMAGLPANWTPQATTAEAWTPSKVGLLPAGEVMQTFIKGILGNSTQLLDDAQAATEKVVASLPKGSKDAVVLSEFLKKIGEAITELKQVLREVQEKNAEISKELGQIKFSQLADKRQKAIEEAEKERKMTAKQRMMSKMGKVMKILGPVVAALSTIVGAALAIFTFGASTALIVAGIAAGTAMTAYSVADSVTGCTAKMVEAFSEAFKSLDIAPWAQQLVKFIVVAMIVAVVAVAAAASGPGQAASLSASVSSQAASTTARAVVQETIRQMLTQAAVMIFTSSNALSDLVVEIVKAKGGGEKAQMIAQILSAVVTMIAVTIGFAKMMTPAKAVAHEADEAVEVANLSLKETAQKALNQIKESAGNISNQSIKEAFQSLGNRIKEFDFKAFMAEQLNKIPQDLKRDWEALKEVTGAEWMSAIFKAIPGIAGAAPAITKGVMLLEISKLLHRIGDLQASQEALMGLIEMLEQLLKRIQTGMSDRDGFITSLQQMYANIYKAADQTYGKMLGALEQHG